MNRLSGILLHPTALPGREGIGTLGAEAYAFLDFLAEAGQQVWQILPIGPTGYGHSPYNALSAFAGNPALIDLESLVTQGDLTTADIADQSFPEGKLSDVALANKQALLNKAVTNFLRAGSQERQANYQDFCRKQASWLDDYVLFMALRTHFQDKVWSSWPAELRRRDPATLSRHHDQLQKKCDQFRCQQFLFFEQWTALKELANQRGIQIFGDMPIFVAYDSADVWAHQELFQLDQSGRPLAVAGVPPDYFSKTGQLWGNPLYNWSRMQETDFAWWLDRFHRDLQCADLVRLDHFRGFQACWSIPVNEKTAINGHWEEVPGAELFACLAKEFGSLPIVAEDLGTITPEVERLRLDTGFPGMKILQFAFDSGPDNPYLPGNFPRESVIYTGTHDNNTTLGWWQAASADQRQAVAKVIGKANMDMPWDLITLAEESISQLCILPCQDILSLGKEARFNTPGTVGGNWCWRMIPGELTAELAARLRHLCHQAGRCN